MSVKNTISTTTSAELEEILKALYPVQIRRKYRLKTLHPQSCCRRTLFKTGF